jgi:hypothetical protein
MVVVVVCGCDFNDKGSVVSVISVLPRSLGFLL